ncbi:coiled-coil domain-containing protein 12-like [Actinia tenebrosa]|uniref:Coiled-coil domain-containing protein 12-like n=1 Tax=Actinia tenebrosa TaxID=6105 RepID=A0A6P8INB1_ACTTE|nr:coiled-coil domain-containing protein 12-like [Actinia tenebrosa]
MAAEMTSNLEEEALKRKEKLRAMRQKSGVTGDQQPEQTRGEKRQAEETSEPIKVIKFRNYVPKDETLKDKKLPDAKPLSVEDEVKEHLEKAKSTNIIEEVDLTNLAPRKPDWDLKRDVAKKLEKLERRTQRAIVELIRERLQDSEKEDLAAAVNAASTDQGFESD